MTKNIQLAWDLYHGYENYKEKSLTHRRFKHSSLIPLIERLKNKNIFTLNKAGESVQGREIFSISIGSGPKKILYWSQMHGDEPTATAAIFDVFNFFLEVEHFKEFKNYLLNNVTLYFLPMVNPDGAEVFERRNSYGIDLNRDALRQESPEAKLLHLVFNSIKPDFGFNMHDQDRDYSAGYSKKNAAVSFLAPPSDYDSTVNESRTKSILLISELYNILSQLIPGHISRYADDFEPRAFGDTFAGTESSIILFESGVWLDDREKKFLRKLNFISILTAAKSVAEDSYLKEDIDTYYSIPENKRLMMDFIIRNVTMIKDAKLFTVDIGINYEEVNIPDSNEFYYKARIEDIGDLSIFTGFKEINAKGLTLEAGKAASRIFSSLDEIKNMDPVPLLKEGITIVKLNAALSDISYSPVVFNIALNNIERVEEIKEGATPNFVLSKDETFKYAVINGFLVTVNNPGRTEGNSLIFGQI